MIVTETVIVSVLASVLAPSLLAYMNARAARFAAKEDAAIRSAERAEDYRRQDEVAARTAMRVAEAHAQTQKVVTTAARASAVVVAAATDQLSARNVEVDADRKKMDAERTIQLAQIHSLVNSNLTAAMQAELTAIQSTVPLIQEVIELQIAQAGMASLDTQAILLTAKAKVERLAAHINLRLSLESRQKTGDA